MIVSTSSLISSSFKFAPFFAASIIRSRNASRRFSPNFKIYFFLTIIHNKDSFRENDFKYYREITDEKGCIKRRFFLNKTILNGSANGSGD